MTVEEALVGVLAVAALVSLFIGLAQALDDRSPRPRSRGISEPSRLRSAPAPLASRPRLAPLTPSRAGSVSWPASPPEPSRGVDAPSTALPDTPAPEPQASSRPEPALVEAAASQAVPAPPALAQPLLARVESCAALCLAGKHAELLIAAEPAIGQGDRPDMPGSGTAMTGLQSLVALSRNALGDANLAAAALHEANRTCPGPVVDGCPPRLAALSVPIARRLLEFADQSAEGVPARIMAARLAAFWLRWRLVAAPGDQGAMGLLEVAAEDISEGYASAVAALIRSQEWVEANRLLREGRDRGELPTARAEVLVEVLAAALRNAVERLTAPAARGSKNESRVQTGLEQAEALLASMAGAGLPSRQWAAMKGRVWRSYANLGIERLRSGSLEAASDALLHALAMPEVGARRQRQVRDAMVETLRCMGEQRARAIERLLADNDRPAAVKEVEGLIAQIQRAREGGLSPDDLMVASTSARQLAEQLEPPRAP